MGGCIWGVEAMQDPDTVGRVPGRCRRCGVVVGGVGRGSGFWGGLDLKLKVDGGREDIWTWRC